VAIQGLGNVGFSLARLVADGGGKLVVTDVRSDVCERAKRELGASIAAPDAIFDESCDVFAPCAMGGLLDQGVVKRLRARIVCGAANNQLATPEIGHQLVERGITYAPDYVVNAGGMLNASGDFFGQYDVDEVWRRVRAIRGTTARVLETAGHEHRPPHEIADAMAQAVIDECRRQITQARAAD
jgi:leucine dehydrogenase